MAEATSSSKSSSSSCESSDEESPEADGEEGPVTPLQSDPEIEAHGAEEVKFESPRNRELYHGVAIAREAGRLVIVGPEAITSHQREIIMNSGTLENLGVRCLSLARFGCLKVGSTSDSLPDSWVGGFPGVILDCTYQLIRQLCEDEEDPTRTVPAVLGDPVPELAMPGGKATQVAIFAGVVISPKEADGNVPAANEGGNLSIHVSPMLD